MFELLWLLIGLAGLWVGAELIIRASVNIAYQFKVSHTFVGLTILAIGTDLPELIVNITASISRIQGIETSGFVFGNIMGSNMANGALAMGIAGIIGTIYLKKREIKRDMFLLIGSMIILFLLVFRGALTQLEGIILIIIYAIYFIDLLREEKIVDKMARAKSADFGWSLISLLGGFAILYFASNTVVNNSLFLATKWGVAQSLIGALIVGFGTSIPELTVAISAIRKGASQLGVGNLIGSNIFNILFALGISATIAPLNVDQGLYFFDLPFLFLTTIITLVLFWKDFRVDTKEAIVLLSIYIIYVILKIIGF